MKTAKRIFILTLGALFVLFGIVGLVLPFLQGFLFLAIGILLISIYSPRIRHWLDSHTVKYPKLHQAVLKVEGWIIKVVGRPE